MRTRRILCVVNVSRAPQAVELDLSDFTRVACRIEMTGGTVLPADRRPALSPDPAGLRLLLVPPHICPRRQPSVPDPARRRPNSSPLVLTGGPDTHLQRPGEAPRSSRTLMPSFIARRRWLPPRGMTVSGAKLMDFAVLKSRSGRTGSSSRSSTLELRSGEQQIYSAPLALEEGREDEAPPPLCRRAGSAGPAGRPLVRRRIVA